MNVTSFICVIAMTSVVLVSALDQATKDYLLKKHNDYRKGEGASNMAKMVWDSKMESEATTWANNCVFEHKGMGENLAYNSATDKPETDLIDTAMQNFFDEKKKYSYGQSACQSSCHYTQLVWHKTTKVGCATKICPNLGKSAGNMPKWYLVCRYDPAGNWMNEKPFLKGAACSACGAGATCEDGLCVGGAAGGSAETCKDSNGRCAEWARTGECAKNPSYMNNECKKSCSKC